MKLPKLKFPCCTHKTSESNPTDIELAPRSADIFSPPTIATVPTAPTAIVQPTAPFPFMQLPPELRLQVYKHALHIADEDNCCVITKETGIPEPPLLFTCKTIRNEATKTFYRRNFFVLILDSWDPATEVLFSRRTKMYRDDELEWRQDVPGQLCWKNFMTWLRLCQTGEAHPLQKMNPEDPRPQACATEMGVFYSFFKIVAVMKEKPWGEIQDILDGLRPGLVFWDLDWRDQ